MFGTFIELFSLCQNLGINNVATNTDIAGVV